MRANSSSLHLQKLLRLVGNLSWHLIFQFFPFQDIHITKSLFELLRSNVCDLYTFELSSQVMTLKTPKMMGELSSTLSAILPALLKEQPRINAFKQTIFLFRSFVLIRVKSLNKQDELQYLSNSIFSLFRDGDRTRSTDSTSFGAFWIQSVFRL